MLNDQELQIVLAHVADGMGLNQAIQAVGKQLDTNMQKWFVPDPRSPELTQQHLAYLAVKKGRLP